MYHASYVPLQLMLQFTCSHIFEINSEKCFKNRKQYSGLAKPHETKVLPKTFLKRAFGLLHIVSLAMDSLVCLCF